MDSRKPRQQPTFNSCPERETREDAAQFIIIFPRASGVVKRKGMQPIRSITMVAYISRRAGKQERKDEKGDAAHFFLFLILQRARHTPLSDKESDMERSLKLHRRDSSGIKKGKGSNHL